MAVMKNNDGSEVFIDCMCGCNTGIRFKIVKDNDFVCYMTYTNGAFYTEQGESIFGILSKKFKKIWAILRNKDYYYSSISMSEEEFEEFRKYINSI